MITRAEYESARRRAAEWITKAGILARLLSEPPAPSLPASWLQGHPGLRLFVDRAALGG